jgi:HTH-type transcriptional repressor of NAD biosynthesis genes
LKRGLVIGKFMPVHNGHVSLINFAASECDEVIVSMSVTSSDPIDAALRFSWITEIFKKNPKIKPAMVADDFDDDSLPLTKRTAIWAAFIQKTYPKIDAVFSSEEYGESFANHLGATHRMFDNSRVQFPVSASKIRQAPFIFWDFIPPVVRPYFVKKICFYGPESTGKSSLTIRMAETYNTTYVPEVAREMLTTNDFSAADIVRIGHAHYDRIEEKLKLANKFLMCDTDAITTQIYSDFYLGIVPTELTALENKVRYDHYFLFDIDVPWIDDGLRDLGHLRKEMFIIFKEALEKRAIKYTLVSGDWQQREAILKNVLDKFLQ